VVRLDVAPSRFFICGGHDRAPPYPLGQAWIAANAPHRVATERAVPGELQAWTTRPQRRDGSCDVAAGIGVAACGDSPLTRSALGARHSDGARSHEACTLHRDYSPAF
jgi:hypothetical protein